MSRRNNDGPGRFRNGYVVHGLTEEYVERLEVLYMAILAAVACPSCGAERGRDCRTAGGNRAIQAHGARHEAWREFLAERYGAILLF